MSGDLLGSYVCLSGVIYLIRNVLAQQNLVLRRRREPDAHPVYDLLLREEMMRSARHSRIITTPCPFEEGMDEVTTYAMGYAQKIEEAYKV